MYSDATLTPRGKNGSKQEYAHGPRNNFLCEQSTLSSHITVMQDFGKPSPAGTRGCLAKNEWACRGDAKLQSVRYNLELKVSIRPGGAVRIGDLSDSFSFACLSAPPGYGSKLEDLSSEVEHMLAGKQRLRIPNKVGHNVMRLVLSVAVIMLIGLQAGDVTHSQVTAAPEAKDRLRSVELLTARDYLEPSYFDVLPQWREEGQSEVEGVHITIDPWDFVDSGYDPRYADEPTWDVVRGIGGRDVDALIWDQEETWLVWEIEVPESGLYNLVFDYYPLEGKRATIQRDIKVNGIYPFNEAKRIIFYRTWRDSGAPKQDNLGNDTRPRQEEVHVWRTSYFTDHDAMYREPLLFFFEEGVNTIELNAIREPMALAALHVVSPRTLPSYAEVKAEYDRLGYKPVENRLIKFQAENAYLKSDPTLRMEFGWDPTLEPPAQSTYRLNQFGGSRWRNGGAWVDWKFEVEEDGLYKLGFKALQNNADRLPVLRSIQIDGEFPAAEWEEVRFDYDRDWKIFEPLSEDGEPMYVYLTKGEHILTMTPVVGPLRRTLALLRNNIDEMTVLARMITMITGPEPDPNFDWEIHRTLPDLLPSLQKLVDSFRAENEFVRSFARQAPRLADQLVMTAAILEDMIRRPDSIPHRLQEFTTQQSSLSTWILRLLEAPLTLDYIMVTSPDSVFPEVKATPVQRMRSNIESFLLSFSTDYTTIGSSYGEDGEEVEGTILELWVGRGREWAMIVKEMIEEDFTPNTGIHVNVNVIPPSQVDVGSQMSVILLAAATGNAPDVSIGSSSSLPVEFAIRNGVVNLNEFPDYEEVATRFRPGALTPFRWTNREGVVGDYALPETQGFSMLFYRIDLLSQFGLTPPDTWTEVIGMLPTLQQFDMNFFYDSQPAGLTPLLYQYGANFYTEDGFFSALDTPEAMEAFKLWTSLFAQYRVPVEASFYNRMRTGEMPIGVANYQTYVQLHTTAPELTGWWEMTPIPGVPMADGQINRSTGGTAEVAVIFKESQYKDESWELIKWWTSAEIQERYGRELEALLGVEARWNTANVEALHNMAWPIKDITAIAEQWEWFQEMPIVLGGYFTSRHIMNAWNRVVLQGQHVREALEIAVKDIDRELRKKQEEFGIEVERPVRQITF